MSQYNLYLNTEDSVNPNEPNNSIFNLGSELVNLAPTKMGISSIQFPNTVYPFNSNYNTLIFEEKDGADTIKLTITPSIYTGSQIASFLSTNMTSSSTQGNTYTVTYNSQTKKITFASAPNNFRILSTSTCLRELGISKLGMEQVPGASTSKVGDYPVSLDGSKYVDIISNIGNNSVSSNKYTNILCRIPLNASFGEVIIYEPSINSMISIRNQAISSLEIRMIDDRKKSFRLAENSSVSYCFHLA